MMAGVQKQPSEVEDEISVQGLKEKEFEIMRPDDIWMMKDADDFLRYLKFEAINYGYLFAHLFKSIYLISMFYQTNVKEMNIMLIICIVWRVADIVELHVIEAYDYPIKALIAKNVYAFLSLTVIAVLLFSGWDELYTNNEVSSSRWVICELFCGIIFQPLYIYHIF